MEKFGFQDKKKKNYFEGWYFRFTEKVNYAVIFAVTKNEQDPHAFIQLFNETMNKCIYKRFDSSDFSYNDGVTKIGENHLSLDDIHVKIDGTEINLKFKDKTTLGKSAMGYLSNAPLDCFQEVIYLGGTAQGTINGVDTEGTIYIEKTYGNKFPKRWLWLQSNHSKNNSMISFSVGYIPFLAFTVPGWLLVLKYKNEVVHFHSLAGARLKLTENGFIVKSSKYKIIVDYDLSTTIQLVGPGLNAHMNISVYESLTATARIKVFKEGKFIFVDEYQNVGLEQML